MFEDAGPVQPAWERGGRLPAPAGVPTVPDEDLDAARFAGLVEDALSRWDGMLFTATPTQDLDAVIACQHLQNQAFALMLRTLTATSNRADGDERYWVADEVALALGVSSGTGDALLRLATQGCELPGLIEAVEANLLSERHVRAVLRVVCDPDLDLPLEHRQAVVAILLARFTGQTPHELTKMLDKLVLQIDLAAAQRRQDAAGTTRGLRSWSRVNGQASVMLTGPTPQIGAVLAALTRQDSLRNVEAGDERSHDNRLFDLAISLLTGGAQASGGWEATIVIPYSTTVGGDLELAEIPGLGPVLPSTARDLLDGALRHRRITVDETGTVLTVDDATPHQVRPTAAKNACPTEGSGRVYVLTAAMRRLAARPVVTSDLSAHRYRIPGRLHRLLEARDRTCVSPAAPDRPAPPTRTTASPGPPALPTRGTCSACADGTIAPSKPPSPCSCSRTTPTPGPPDAPATPETDHPRAGEPPPRAPQPSTTTGTPCDPTPTPGRVTGIPTGAWASRPRVGTSANSSPRAGRGVTGPPTLAAAP